MTLDKDDSIRTQVDEAIDESFPASDPPSWMPKSTTRMTDEELSEEKKQQLAEEAEANRQNKIREEAQWLEEKEAIDKTKAQPDAIPVSMRDPSAAPLGTDQEAGPATSKPPLPSQTISGQGKKDR